MTAGKMEEIEEEAMKLKKRALVPAEEEPTLP
jgi:hypothetical protein